MSSKKKIGSKSSQNLNVLALQSRPRQLYDIFSNQKRPFIKLLFRFGRLLVNSGLWVR